MRIAVIDLELCNPSVCDFLCVRLCPRNRAGESCITREEVMKKFMPKIDEGLCIGCGICSNKCPKKAITIINTPEELKEYPMHRYGKNAFVLFRLPVPVKGVVGLLGANGVGKTTALQILSGNLKPNLGKKEAEWKDIIKLHRGSELQDYFEKLSEGKITAVYKPQNVSVLTKMKKKVKELEIKEELIKDLELTNCLNQNLSELSGGELQRTAIAVALSRDVDIYYFDEPSSYLDVKQRINVARAIRKKAEEKYVMVVEHDLATLDFIADRIHIFYGAPGVFGVVSKPYATKNGINAFLSGFIKEDNVRIRDATNFEITAMDKKKGVQKIVEFSGIKKKLDRFELAIEKGEIRKDEVLGIFGPNALGKTTFAKILAGEIKAEGEISKKLKISYKPQYIESDFEGTVNELLKTVKKHERFNILSNRLNIEKLLEKKVNKLSGGELQRVAILICLSNDCDLYLLDEPSAYLDVDQRLAVAKAIRDSGTCAVIDHDLLFLSYIADRAMVFSGESGLHGSAECMTLHDGFNKFLKEVGVTFRRDPETKRPRANKLDSVKDREQKERGEYFYE